MQTRRAQAERCRHAIGARFGAPTQHLPSGHPLGRTPPQPRRAVLHGRPPAPVQADRTAHDHGGRVSDALTRGQVDPRDALPGAAPIKCGLVALALRLSLWWRRGGTGLGVRGSAGAARRCELAVTLQHFLGRDFGHGHRVGQGAQGLLAPLTGERLGKSLFAVLTARVPEPRACPDRARPPGWRE